MATKDPDLDEPLELGARGHLFPQRVSQELRRRRRKGTPSQTTSERALQMGGLESLNMCETPDWWRELLAVPGVPDCKKLAQEGVGLIFSSQKGK